MKRSRFSEEQIIAILREQEAGAKTVEVCRKHGISDATFYPGLIYSRINNPDLEMLEDRLAIWDQAEASLVFASGMAAISTTLWAYARPGTVIIHSGPVYGGTDFLLKKILPQFGVTSIGFLSEGGNRAMEEAVRSARGKGPIAALYIETPANPTNGMVDLE